MSDFTANPDDLEVPDHIALSPVRRIKGRLSGLHPEADLPHQRGPERASCALLCAFCGTLVLHARTPEQRLVWLDLSRKTWVITHREGSELPRVSRSRGYVEHTCKTESTQE
jgi:hypothetical protein